MSNTRENCRESQVAETSVPEINRRDILQLGAAAAMAGIGFGRPAMASERRKIVVAVPALPDQLDPAVRTASRVYRVLVNLFDLPVRIDYLDGWQIKNALAASFTQVSSTTYEMKIRKGVKFHDGSTMTADDVVFSLGPDRLLEKGAPGYQVKRAIFPSLSAVEKIDESTVRLHTSIPDPNFLKRFASWGSQIVSAKAFRSHSSFEDWARNPVGTGPYKLARFEAGSFIEVESHDDYWGGLPPLKGIRFQLVPELGTRVAGMLSGDYDIAVDIPPDQFATVRGNPGLEIVGGDNAAFRVVFFDALNNPQLKDVNLRRALSLSVDRQKIVDSLWEGRLSVPGSHQLPIYGELFDPQRAPVAFDIEKAKHYLSQSSYKGEAIPFRSIGTYYTSEMPTNQVLVAMWKAIGVNVQLEIKENWSQIYKKPGRGISNSADGILFPDPVASLWRRYGAGSALQKKRDLWTNAEFNKLGETLQYSEDVQARKAAFQKMLDIYDMQDPPGFVLHSFGRFYAAKKDLRWKPYPTAQMDFRPGVVL
ncbi:MAG: ABC transporter substrate-binding protein [Hyphomicrobiales bacterium]|nr:ABC transporter substrate-binding protein [Hyphomicrobiales bacterium]